MAAELERKFYSGMSVILEAGHGIAYRAVNSAVIETYWRLGRRIVEEEQQGSRRAAAL